MAVCGLVAYAERLPFAADDDDDNATVSPRVPAQCSACRAGGCSHCLNAGGLCASASLVPRELCARFAPIATSVVDCSPCAEALRANDA
jgi:hypothetical protein